MILKDLRRENEERELPSAVSIGQAGYTLLKRIFRLDCEKGDSPKK
jgi:hypothetical protein